MPELLYFAGPPAAGKSTLVAHLCRDLEWLEALKPLAHQTEARSGVVQLGRLRPGFPGTDTLSMGALPVAEAWLTGPDAPGAVIAEGDRLASAPFFDRLRAAGWTVTLAVVLVPADVLEARRAARTDWTPNPSWLKGRDTKAYRLAEVADLIVDGTNLTGAAADLASHPVATLLAEARR